MWCLLVRTGITGRIQVLVLVIRIMVVLIRTRTMGVVGRYGVGIINKLLGSSLLSAEHISLAESQKIKRRMGGLVGNENPLYYI